MARHFEDRWFWPCLTAFLVFIGIRRILLGGIWPKSQSIGEDVVLVLLAAYWLLPVDFRWVIRSSVGCVLAATMSLSAWSAAAKRHPPNQLFIVAAFLAVLAGYCAFKVIREIVILRARISGTLPK